MHMVQGNENKLSSLPGTENVEVGAGICTSRHPQRLARSGTCHS
jgi:hypothetical protein